jgi:hypothetical protein
MISTADGLASVLGLDLSTASKELAEARLQRDRRDTSSNRAAVAGARARIDALLDMYLETGRPAR